MNKLLKLSIVTAALIVSTLDACDSCSEKKIVLKQIGAVNVSESNDNKTEVTAEDMALSSDGKFVFLADGSAGLKVIDVSNSSDPVLVGHYDNPCDNGSNLGGFARRITISSDRTTVFMADGLAGLKIIDVTDPTEPTLLGKLDTKGFSHGITISEDDNTIYISDNGEDGGTPGLRIVDVSDRTNPTMITQRDEQWATQVALSPDGEKLFITDKKAGILIADANSCNFKEATLGKYTVTDKGISADILLSKDGEIAYVANKKPGIKILDVSNPENPKLLAKYDTDGFKGKSIAKSIALSKDGKKLFVANRSTGVEVLDVSNPKKPKLLATLDTSGSAEDVMLSNDGKKLFVADGKEGIKIISIQTK